MDFNLIMKSLSARLWRKLIPRIKNFLQYRQEFLSKFLAWLVTREAEDRDHCSLLSHQGKTHVLREEVLVCPYIHADTGESSQDYDNRLYFK